MPLTRTDLPSTFQEQFTSSAAILNSALAPETVRLLSGGLSSFFFISPVYDLKATEILGGINLRGGKLVAWNFLMPDKAGQLTSVAVGTDASGTARPNSIVLGQGLPREETPLAVGLEEAEDRTYTINLLRILSLSFSAVWLRSDRKEHDLFVPLAPTPPGINADERYDEERLAELLRALARYQLALGPEGDA